MSSKQPVGFDVETEVRRRALHPPLRVLDHRNAVVTGVDLNDGELRCVEPQPIFRRRCTRGIELPTVDKGLVGPRRGAYENRHRARASLRPEPLAPEALI